MQHPLLDTLLAPVVGWMAFVSCMVILYLAALEIEQRRRNRRMHARRQRLGLEA